jgi:hypothetical protein
LRSPETLAIAMALFADQIPAAPVTYNWLCIEETYK